MAVVVEMGKNTPVQTAYAIKDAPTRDTKVTQQIVVGTPGTMADMLRRRQIDPSGLKVFVLDEADHMLDAQSLGEYTLRIKKYVFLRGKNMDVLLFYFYIQSNSEGSSDIIVFCDVPRQREDFCVKVRSQCE